MDFAHYMESLDSKNFLPKRKGLDNEDHRVLSESTTMYEQRLHNTKALDQFSYRLYFIPLLLNEMIENRADNNRHSQYNIRLFVDPKNRHMPLLKVLGLQEDNPHLELGDVVNFHPLWADQPSQILPLTYWNNSADHGLNYSWYCSDGYGVRFITHIFEVLRDRDLIRLHEPSLTLNMNHASFNVSFPVQERRYRSMLAILHILEDDFEKIRERERERAQETRAPWLSSMLFPTESDGVTHFTREIPEIPRQWNDPELSKEQKKAINDICERNYGQVPFLISGPPGTGKTKTLVETALQLITHGDNDEHILICAPSESAADSIAERLAQSRLAPKELLRLNPPSRRSNEMKETLRAYSAIDETGIFFMPEFQTIMEKKIIVTTCLTASLLVEGRLTNADLFHLEYTYAKVFHRSITETVRLHWTALLFDESTQAIEPEAVIPLVVVAVPVTPDDISVRPIVVLAGDEHQLGPQTFSNDPRLKTSLFTRLLNRPLYANHPGSRTGNAHGHKSTAMGETRRKRAPFANLIQNYRSHAAILAIPSYINYGDTLIAKAEHHDSLLGLSIWRGRKWPVLFVPNLEDEKFEPMTSATWNDAEPGIALQYVREILSSGQRVKQSEIGIMSPFQTNVRNIRRIMADMGLNRVDIGPCDAFQGLEKRIIILCTTRTREKYLKTDLELGKGVIFQPNRMNVCLTRARQGLIVIGNPKLLGMDPKWALWLGFCKRNGLVSDPYSESSNWDIVPEKMGSLPSLERYLLTKEFPAL